MDVDALHATRENSLLQVFRPARISAGGVVTVALSSSLFPLRAGRNRGGWLCSYTRLKYSRLDPSLTAKQAHAAGSFPPLLILLPAGRPAPLSFTLKWLKVMLTPLGIPPLDFSGIPKGCTREETTLAPETQDDSQVTWPKAGFQPNTRPSPREHSLNIFFTLLYFVENI